MAEERENRNVVSMGMERRFVAAPASLEKRVDAKPVVAGYGARYYDIGDPGTEYELAEGIVERIMPGAFDRCVREKQDVRVLFNHDQNNVLGRTSAGTARLSVDATGFRYEADPPDTQPGRDVCTLLSRGDVTGSSFSFFVRKQTIQYKSGTKDDPDIRLIQDVDVLDVGPVTFPAYEATSAGVTDPGRAAIFSAEARDAWKRGRAEVEARIAEEKKAADLAATPPSVAPEPEKPQPTIPLGVRMAELVHRQRDAETR